VFSLFLYVVGTNVDDLELDVLGAAVPSINLLADELFGSRVTNLNE
jgi:hypothetical protein